MADDLPGPGLPPELELPPRRRGPAPGPNARIRKPKRESLPPDTRPLLVRLEERYSLLRDKSGTIRRLEKEIESHNDNIRRHTHLKNGSKSSLVRHEKWLKEEAAAQIRKEAGILTIPGFVSTREQTMAHRREVEARAKQAQADGLKSLNIAPAPPAPIL